MPDDPINLQRAEAHAPLAQSAPRSTLLHEFHTILEPLTLTDHFPTPQPLEVELGCGDGSFLIEWARRNPGRNLLGVERLLGRIRKPDKVGRRLGLTNISLVRIEISYFLEYLLPAASTDALHVYFPDPWPKVKHRKYRLINDRFPALARRALKPGGIVHLRTDHVEYFAQMLAVFRADKSFTEMEPPAELTEVTTDFEREFNAKGIPTNRASWRL
ncbi:MAG: tRNA (guanosine(46)-N7)-methyltransferase TrmB [Verrucomicrobia bacterium]|nr:tRNA (guanosine(46)-N7)-methyltransferase TrmB [Verrucomicrobiota bacterium]